MKNNKNNKKNSKQKFDIKTVALIIVSVIAVLSIGVSAVCIVKLNSIENSISFQSPTAGNTATEAVTNEVYTEEDDEDYSEDEDVIQDTQPATQISAFTEVTPPTAETDVQITYVQETQPPAENEIPQATTTPERTYTLPQKGDTVSSAFTPYKCITPEGEVISDDFNEKLGGEGTSIQLNEDGTYSFVLGNIISSSGTYELDGNAITLSDGYSGTVTYDELRTPIAIIISAEGYQAYFN